jgi:hypothetical protein
MLDDEIVHSLLGLAQIRRDLSLLCLGILSLGDKCINRGLTNFCPDPLVFFGVHGINSSQICRYVSVPAVHGL